ncbi:MAG: putative viral replication protein [Cressdnaviricota sp.]|nr:MAG: putative viral replication protein [Cressdnaviricota sp.]
MTSRNYCFTLFDAANVENAPDSVLPGAYVKDIDDIKNRKGDSIARYWILQKEKCPTSGRHHIQGYIEFLSPVRFSVIQKFFGEKCHCEPRKGTQEEAIKYCMKEESRLVMFCEAGEKALGSDQANARVNTIDWIMSNPEATYKDYVCYFSCEYMRYANNMDKLWNMFKYRPPSFEFDSLLPIQNEMIEIMENQDGRDIPWIYDPDGGTGKSVLADYLSDRGDCFWASTGGYKDVFHAYSKVCDEKPYVIIDITREEGMEPRKIDHIYGILEALKNGRAFSGKYDSVSLTFPKAKVLVLANCLPDPTKWSSKGPMSRYKKICHLSQGEGNTSLALISHCDILEKKDSASSTSWMCNKYNDNDIDGEWISETASIFKNKKCKELIQTDATE